MNSPLAWVRERVSVKIYRLCGNNWMRRSVSSSSPEESACARRERRGQPAFPKARDREYAMNTLLVFLPVPRSGPLSLTEGAGSASRHGPFHVTPLFPALRGECDLTAAGVGSPRCTARPWRDPVHSVRPPHRCCLTVSARTVTPENRCEALLHAVFSLLALVLGLRVTAKPVPVWVPADSSPC